MAPGMLARFRGLGWEPYAWLIYSLPFLVAAFSPRLSRGEQIAMLAAYPVFVVLYLSGHWVRGPRIVWTVAALDVMAVVFGGRNPPAATFFIYGSALLGQALPARQAVPAVVAQVALAAFATFALSLTAWFLIPATVISALVGAVTIQAALNESRNASLRRAHAEIERLAQVAERERIARDLHDLLGHTLSVVVLKSELAQKLLARDPERARREVADVERIAREGLAEVRQAITGYRSAGLPAEIERVRHALTSAGIHPSIDPPPPSMEDAHETAVSLALREATTNVIRHSRARRCVVRFRTSGGRLVMDVEDDGCGTEAPFGHGLTGMRERIERIGGTVTRESGRGTRVRVDVPLPAALDVRTA